MSSFCWRKLSKVFIFFWIENLYQFFVLPNRMSPCSRWFTKFGWLKKMGTSYNNNLNQVRKTIWLWCKDQIIKTLLIYVQTKTNLTIKPTRYIYIFKENGSCWKVFSSKQSQNSTINLFVPRLNKQFLIQKFFLLMHFLYFEKINFSPFFPLPISPFTLTKPWSIK